MTFNEIADEVLPQLPGALIASIRDAAVLAARELCTEADVWQEETDLYVPAGRLLAEVDPPSASAEVLRVASIVGLRPGRDYEQPQPGMVQIHSTHSEPRRLVAMVVCRPKQGIGRMARLPVPLERWREAISYNTLYRMMRMPAVEWSNPALAEHYRQLYLEHLSDARRTSVDGAHCGSRRSKPQRFI